MNKQVITSSVLAIFLSLILISFIAPHKYEPPVNLQTSKFDQFLSYCYENGMFNGSIAVLQNDQILYKASLGTRERGSRTLIDNKSQFYIASVSKQFTATLCLILQEKGLMNLDDKVSKYLVEYKNLDQNMKISHLLNHTSGISDRAYYKIENPDNESILKVLEAMEPEEFAAAGKQFSYSNTGYVLLAKIIEQITKKTISEVLEEEIFAPLNMQNTRTSKQISSKSSNSVKAYSVIGKSAEYKSTVVGPGGIYSTLEDMLKWNQALNRNTLISKESQDIAFKNGRLDTDNISFTLSQKNYGYACGWILSLDDENTIVKHDGSTAGYRSLVYKDLSNKIDIIILTNHGGGLAIDQIVSGMCSIVKTGDYTKPQVPITNQFVNDLMQYSLDESITRLKEIIATTEIPDERTLGSLGYTYLQDGDTEIALSIFELNLELHPQSVNALYVLGETYFTSGAYEKSKNVYLKYQDVKPDSKHAKSRLEQIDHELALE